MNWTIFWTATGVVIAFGALMLTIGKMLANRIDEGNRKNDLQLSKQRRVDRELFGEDPDNPTGPKGPTLRQMVATVDINTRGLPDRMASAESRLGKLEDRFNLLEEVILRRPGGN